MTITQWNGTETEGNLDCSMLTVDMFRRQICSSHFVQYILIYLHVQAAPCGGHALLTPYTVFPVFLSSIVYKSKRGLLKQLAQP
jgi:hypothetical protein